MGEASAAEWGCRSTAADGRRAETTDRVVMAGEPSPADGAVGACERGCKKPDGSCTPSAARRLLLGEGRAGPVVHSCGDVCYAIEEFPPQR